MSVWLLTPTVDAEKCGETFAKWKTAGYMTAAFVDAGAATPDHADVVVSATYCGYGAAINRLWEIVRRQALIIIPGGDDLYPCTTRTVGELASDFFARFANGFGVMHLAQFDLSGGASADHPWIGNAYASRVNGGRGPIWPEYWHWFNDQEAREVAERLGVFWRRPELGQLHDHWTLHDKGRPPHLERIVHRWPDARALFLCRQASGFPGHEPCEQP